MKFIYPLLILTFFVAACDSGTPAGSSGNGATAQKANDSLSGTPGAFYRRYSGSRGNRNIVLHLIRYKDRVLASYSNVSDNRPVMLTAQPDTAVSGTYTFTEGMDHDIAWSLADKGNALTGICTKSGSPAEPVSLTESYPEGSYKLTAWYLQDTGRLFKNHTQPKATTFYGMLWPAAGQDAETSAFLESRISVTMQFEGTNGIKAGLKTRASRFFAGYRNELSSVVDTAWPEEKRADMAYRYMSSFFHQVLYNDQNWLVLESAVSNYTGGAHGTYTSSFQNLDLEEHRSWRLSDVVSDSAALKPYLELAVRDYFGIKSTEDLSSRLLTDEVPVTGNFYITPGGLTFVYNPYELASYSDGAVQLFLAFDKVMPLLQPEFKKRMNFSPRTGVALAHPAHNTRQPYFSTNSL
jgi:hypothetical protein